WVAAVTLQRAGRHPALGRTGRYRRQCHSYRYPPGRAGALSVEISLHGYPSYLSLPSTPTPNRFRISFCFRFPRLATTPWNSRLDSANVPVPAFGILSGKVARLPSGSISGKVSIPPLRKAFNFSTFCGFSGTPGG